MELTFSDTEDSAHNHHVTLQDPHVPFKGRHLKDSVSSAKVHMVKVLLLPSSITGYGQDFGMLFSFLLSKQVYVLTFTISILFVSPTVLLTLYCVYLYIYY